MSMSYGERPYPALVAGGVGAVLAVALVAGVALVVALLGAGGRKGRWLAAWRRAAPRLWWRCALAALGLGALAVATYVTAARSHVKMRFLDGEVVGMVVAGAAAAAAAAAVVAGLALDRWAGPIAERVWRRGALALRGRPLLTLALWLVGATAVALAPVAVVRVAVPALTRGPVVVGSALAVLALWAATSSLGALRGVRAAAVVAGVAVALAPWLALRSPPARRAAIEHGALGKAALRLATRLGDRDRDGHAARAFGGADCDDHDATRHPLAAERAGDGRDDNCSGAEAAPAAHRLAPGAAPTAGGARPDVVLISIDALRADRLGAWGYRRPVSPNLDALAARSTRFAWAFTSCPSTRCAMPALMTGRFASTLKGPAPTLASVLRDAGWQTASITCCERFLDAREVEGFTVIDPSAHAARLARPGQSNADLVMDAVLRYLDQPRGAGAAPYFLWIHLYEPHSPYYAPEQPRRFGASEEDRYDAEIRYLDEQLGRLLAALSAPERRARTVLAVTADHGDEFGEHGIRFHARSLYNQVVHVPLLVHLPPELGGAGGRVAATPVSVVDVMPTLLELAGVQVPGGLNGRSLAAAARGGEVPTRPVLLELVPDHQIHRNLAGLVWRSWKLIWDREVDAWSLYSLERDPRDLDDRAAAEPDLLRELRDELGRVLDGELGEIEPKAP